MEWDKGTGVKPEWWHAWRDASTFTRKEPHMGEQALHRHSMAERHNTDTIQRHNVTPRQHKRQNMTEGQHRDTTWQRPQRDNVTYHDRENRHNATQRHTVTQKQHRETMWQRQNITEGQHRDTTWHRDNTETHCDTETVLGRDNNEWRETWFILILSSNSCGQKILKCPASMSVLYSVHLCHQAAYEPAARKDCPNLLYNETKRPQS